jgi:hypothetical protein
MNLFDIIITALCYTYITTLFISVLSFVGYYLYFKFILKANLRFLIDSAFVTRKFSAFHKFTLFPTCNYLYAKETSYNTLRVTDISFLFFSFIIASHKVNSQALKEKIEKESKQSKQQTTTKKTTVNKKSVTTKKK